MYIYTHLDTKTYFIYISKTKLISEVCNGDNGNNDDDDDDDIKYHYCNTTFFSTAVILNSENLLVLSSTFKMEVPCSKTPKF